MTKLSDYFHFPTFIFLLVCTIPGIGQNLVPNPGFELYTQCPSGFTSPTEDQMIKATGWSSYSETPDYFHVCATSYHVTVPSNSIGYQFPHTGNAYCGGASYNKFELYREIVGRPLSSPLIIGEKYYVSFYTCMGGKPGFNFATNNIGVKFTTSPHNYISNPIAINNFAHLNYDTLITDSTNWKLITGSFIADSAYQYIALGNFYDDFNTDTFCVDNAALTLDGYYYIDDICVSIDSLYAATWTGITDNYCSGNFSISPNPVNENATINFDNPDNENCTLYLFNFQGQLVRTIPDILASRTEIKREDLPVGIYFLYLKTERRVIGRGKLIIE